MSDVPALRFPPLDPLSLTARPLKNGRIALTYTGEIRLIVPLLNLLEQAIAEIRPAAYKAKIRWRADRAIAQDRRHARELRRAIERTYALYRGAGLGHRSAIYALMVSSQFADLQWTYGHFARVLPPAVQSARKKRTQRAQDTQSGIGPHPGSGIISIAARTGIAGGR